MSNKLKIILMSISVVFAIVTIKLNTNSNLEIFKGTNLENYDRVDKVLKLIDYGKILQSVENLNDSLIINYDTEIFNYKTLEKNASILFYLLNDLKVITYKINNEIYSFDYDKIALIYNNFDNINISDINNRYKSKYFSSIYLGNINGQIDLFDTSDICLENYIELYQDKEFVYYITCSDIDDIIVVADNKEYKLHDALKLNIIQIDDLFDTNIKIKKDGLDRYENISE